MRPRATKSPNKAKGKAKAKAKPASTPSDDENAFQSPAHEDETDYGLDFTSSRLGTPRRIPSSTMNKSRKTHQQGDEENRPPAVSPRRRASEQQSQQNRQRVMNPYDDAYDDDDDDDDYDGEENQPAVSSPRLRSSQQQLQHDEDSYDDDEEESQPQRQKSNQSTRKPTQPPPPQQRKAPAAATKRKKTKPEHRMIRMQREINRLQETDKYIIPRLPFSRLVRELMAEHTNSVFKITLGALEALQTSTEMYLTQRFEDAYLLTKYRGRVTLEIRDMALVSYFCRTYGNN